MAEHKFNIKLDVNNIGPHYGNKKLPFSDEVDSNKAVFFATNGTGKSFISRAFRLTSSEKRNELADELLTLGQASGNLTFSITDNRNTRKLSVTIEKGKVPTIADNTGLLYHVFNSDYVEENIKPRHYTPDGHIEGYILGKTQIDLTEDREKEAEQTKELDKSSEAIDTAIEDAKTQLRNLGVIATTTEFALLERPRLQRAEDCGSVEKFDVIVEQLDALSKIPEKISEVDTPTLRIDTSVFLDIETILTTAYPKTEWDEGFALEIKAHRSFIEDGLAQIDDDGGELCPFCKQPIADDALTLIKRYKAYLSDREAETLRKIEVCVSAVKGIITTIKQTASSTDSAIVGITGIRKYFPSLSEVELEVMSAADDDLQEFKSVIKLLEGKTAKLACVLPEITAEIEKCKAKIKAYEELVSRNASLIKRVNTTRNDSNGERLSLRRNLCKAQYLKLCKTTKPLFSDFEAKDLTLKELQNHIIEKEQKARISKKDKVFETLTLFLNRFFSGKYSIDKDTFQIQFLGSNVGDKASSILSDGEKSIVAFCYYFASTHLIIERENDYNKLFFIIDDPISSMDFHYVYAVAQSLRTIRADFGMTTHARIWVFTHNMEFMSIVARNHILPNVYVMKPGVSERLQHQLLYLHVS